MNKRLALSTWVLISSLALLGGCASTPPAPVSIADTIARTPELSTLNNLVTDAGLADVLRGPGPFTVFAPTNEAFETVPAKTMSELAGNKDLLKSVLSFHVMPGSLAAAAFTNTKVKSVQGAELNLARAGGDFVTVEEAVVVKADIAASNGTIHQVDRVLMPPKR